MRPTVLFTLVALVLLVGSAATYARSSGGDGTAFALVDPNGGSPTLVAEHTRGFVSVTSPFPGDYCLTAASGTDVAHTAAVVNQEAFYSSVLGQAAVRYPDAASRNCGDNQLEVKTFTPNPTALTDQIGFTVNVPQRGD